MIFRSKNPGETKKIAFILAQMVISIKSTKQATVLALEGELGAGKTTFVKGFVKALGIKTHITSPTFVLMKSYKLSALNYKLLRHIDAYRLKNYKELLPLGIKEILKDPSNIILIEWAERVKLILPKKYIKVHIDHLNKRTRKITIKTI